MTIHASGSNFISNSEILTWMQHKTDGIYGHMRDAMDTSNTRADAEDALNTIKGKLSELKTKNATPEEVKALVDKAIKDYPDVPEVEKVLGSFAKDLDAQQEAATIGASQAQGELNRISSTYHGFASVPRTMQGRVQELMSLAHPKALSIDDAKVETWTKEIGTTVEGLGKQDQLGLINIQEFNAQLNQAKQTASALMDAADKAANSIINHIA